VTAPTLRPAAETPPHRHLHPILAAGGVLYVLAIGTVDINFRLGSTGSDVPSPETAAALVFWLVASVFGMPLLPGVIRQWRSAEPRLVLLILAFGLALAFRSPDPAYSVAAVATHAAAFVFAGVAVATLSVQRLTFLTALGAVMYAAGSLILYAFVPAIGHHHHVISLGPFTFSRLAGLSHPNKVGLLMVLGAGAWIASAPRVRASLQLLTPAVLVLLGTTLFLTYSRTAVITGLLGLLVMRVRTLGQRLAVVSLIALIVAGTVVVAFDRLSVDTLAVLSRQASSTEEVITLSGRLLIWASSLSYILQRPILGWGFASNRSLLAGEFTVGGFVPDQAHNLLLNTAMTLGTVGLGLLFLIFVRQVTRRPTAGASLYWRFVVVAFLFSTLTESYVFAGMPTVIGFIWFVSVYRLAASAPERPPPPDD